MKKVISLLLVFTLVFSCMSTISFAGTGTTYFIDSVSGNDENSGTSPSNAWKTIEKASEKTYCAGDKILFKAGGVYEGNFVAKGNGTADKPITISAYGDTEADGLPLITTQKDVALILIHNVSGWNIENLEMTAPNGKGVYIFANNETIIKNFTIKNCVIHDVFYKPLEYAMQDYSAVRIISSGKNAHVENVTLSELNIYDCDFGISMHGTTIEWDKENYASPEESYHQNFLYENITVNNLLYDAIIITSVNNLIIRNCALLNTALRADWCTAPMWSHHTKNMLIENCEIAGTTNIQDGMSIDFDGWTTDSMYQYIYSHDNIRFITNCVYDSVTNNRNCTVRYCLSVNDNKKINELAWLAHAYDDDPGCMENFKFYNNTIVNGSSFNMMNLKDAYFANNIFCGNLSQNFETWHVSRDKEAGTQRDFKFDGILTNNCFYGCAIPRIAENSVLKNPLFAGDDSTDKNSFMLSENSPLIGKGIQVENDMGEHDFYGNPLTDTHNIGCYEGTGESTQAKTEPFACVADLFKIILGYIANLIVDFREYYL